MTKDRSNCTDEELWLQIAADLAEEIRVRKKGVGKTMNFCAFSSDTNCMSPDWLHNPGEAFALLNYMRTEKDEPIPYTVAVGYRMERDAAGHVYLIPRYNVSILADAPNAASAESYNLSRACCLAWLAWKDTYREGERWKMLK